MTSSERMVRARAAIVAGSRTPIGRRGGAFATLRARDLGAAAIAETLARSTVEPEAVDDVVLGSTLAPEGNPARVAALQAGVPIRVPARSIDRQCGSGIDSVWMAAQAITSGAMDIVLAGGMESMTHEPFQLERSARAFAPTPPQFLARELSPAALGNPGMGTTAENLAESYAISRSEQDRYACTSQRRMADATAAGVLDEAIVPVTVGSTRIERDEHPRPDTTEEKLGALRPAFLPGGTVTAGNASGINDGASCVMVMSEDEVRRRDLAPLAWVVDGAVVGVDPNVMGIGPAPAIGTLLDRTGWRLDEVDVIEINEAFAVQVLACAADLGIDSDRVNAWGGAIAHGHPIAATGTVLIMKAIDQLARAGGGRAIVSACIGGGQGIALAIERDRSAPGVAGWRTHEHRRNT
ncbi:thiolase family protein [Leucobacter sp. L43]|uniref:thiolase family protein n=1 Tax=Leucobacter sp. L43 TaxID=2798040 RepID=UPI001908F6CE|nr:thiolase family protein [Leucobacter sp. L43]